MIQRLLRRYTKGGMPGLGGSAGNAEYGFRSVIGHLMQARAGIKLKLRQAFIRYSCRMSESSPKSNAPSRSLRPLFIMLPAVTCVQLILLELLCFYIADQYAARWFALALVVCSVASLVLGLSLVDRVLQRITAVSTLVERFEQGDFSERLTDSSADEIGELAAKCNRIADGIEATIDELERSERVRSDLISGITYDLRSPLTNLRDYAGLLNFTDPARKEREIDDFLSMVSAEIDSLSRMLQELSELAKLEGREWLPERLPFALEEAIYEAARGLQPAAKARDITVRLEQGQVLPYVLGDSAMIEQVLHHLIEITVQYTKGGGNVGVTCAAAEPSVTVTVASSGIVLPASELAHLCQQFSGEAHGSREGVGPGGLGLAIVRRMLELHDSMIELENGPGDELRFRFSLPRAVDSEHVDEIAPQS